jgi:gliding motility-associated-like protein
VDQVIFEDQWLGFGWQGGYFNEPPTRLVFKVDGPNSTVPSAPNCSYSPPGGFAIGTWYHAAGVMNYTTQQAKLYLNGQLVDTKSITTPPITRTIPTELSYNWSNDPHSLRGNMDEVRIWNTPRTASEIATYYNQCVDPTEQNLVLYYHCNQSAGTTVVDATPNHWDGTFSVAQGWSADQPTLAGTACIASCIEICGNGIDDNNDGQVDENCDCQAVSAGADTTICSGNSVQLNATSGFTDYLWSPATGLSDPAIANPIASPSATTTYTVTALMQGPELVVNGDFSAGNVGFTSNQNYSTTYSPCNYDVGPQFFTYPDPTLTDHTPTSDNMLMAIDGCPSPTIIWEETMLVIDPNTNYTFSFWASRADQVQPTFEIHLIGNVTGDVLISTTPGIPYTGIWTWDQYGVASWGSGSNTSVIVRVINLQTNSYGNDFAVDDFSFRKRCSVTDAVQVTINGSANLTLDLGPDIGLCSAGTHTFDAGSGFATYLWNDGTGTQTFTAFGVGTYWVTVTDSCGGTQTDTVHITLSPQPTLDLGADRVICLHMAAQLGFTSPDSFTSYQWNPSTGLSCDHCPNPIANPPVSTMYHLIASTAQGCIATDSVEVLIEENAPLSISVTVTDATCEDGGIVQLGTVVGGSDLVWYNFNHQGFSHNTMYSGLQGGVYPLTVQNGGGGCEFDTVVGIKGEDYTVYIPNSFTPNGDTYNTQWYILGNCIAELECRIFNRWGQEIFTFDDIDEGWDGKYEGKPVPDGVYTYVVRLVYGNEDVKLLTGFITVLR